MLEVGMTI